MPTLFITVAVAVTGTDSYAAAACTNGVSVLAEVHRDAVNDSSCSQSTATFAGLYTVTSETVLL